MSELIKLDINKGIIAKLPERRTVWRRAQDDRPRAPSVGLTKTAAAARLAAADFASPGYADEVLSILATEKPRD